jgi:hypothetical protein
MSDISQSISAKKLLDCDGSEQANYICERREDIQNVQRKITRRNTSNIRADAKLKLLLEINTLN